jgi:peptidoglycan/xylan/chitin deacetylase (PgdA/CDA1 family)
MSWARRIRPVVDRAARATGVLRACERRMLGAVTILTYHRVLDDDACRAYPFPSLAMPRSAFEAQVRFLAERARVMTVSAALAHQASGASTTRPLVCLSFDDGYIDNFDFAAPVLERHGVRGTFFITIGAAERRSALWYDRAAALHRTLGPQGVGRACRDRGLEATGAERSTPTWIEWLKSIDAPAREAILDHASATAGDGANAEPCPLMTPSQVRELSARGHEIGSHTMTHPILTRLDAARRCAEIVDARAHLQAIAVGPVAGFCYPNGDFDDDVVRDVRNAGHGYACTTTPGRNGPGADPFRLKRIDMTPDRVLVDDGRFDPLGFRAEVCLLRQWLRGRRAEPRRNVAGPIS